MAFSDLDHLRSRRLGELSGVAERDRLVMFRSSVAAFYPLPRRDFYRCGSCQRGRFRTRARWPLVCSEVKKIVDRMAEILFAAEIAFRRLDGGMSQQELNLLKFTTAAVAQLGTGSPQVVRCNMLQARFLAAASDYVPHNILRDAFAPHRSRPGDGSKNPPLRDASGHRPLIERGFDPLWNGNRPNVAALANQIDDCPVTLAHLELIPLQANQFRPAKATTKQHGQHRVIALGTEAATPGMLEDFRAFLGAQPVASTEPELLHSFHTADSCRQFGTQETRIGGFVSQAAHGCELLVDGVGGQTTGFEVHAVANDDDAIESQTGLGAVPGDELIDGVLVNAARGWRAETVEHGQFAMIQIGQPKHSATVIRLDSLFAHKRRPPMPQDWNYGRRSGRCKCWQSVRVWRVLSAIACSRQFALRVVESCREQAIALKTLQ